ncbi:MAG: RNA methyltransferase [Cyclobacteriaceae bacterium]
MVKLSKAHTKFIKSLQLKKYRQAEQAFVVEGEKSVLEVIASDFEVNEVICSSSFYENHAERLAGIQRWEADDLSPLGSFRSNNQALAVVNMKKNQAFAYTGGMVLALDDVNDPGNFGTILRIADWFGITGILASPNTCELYNPKVISASKGSFTRIPVYFDDLDRSVKKLNIPVLAADMDGENVHNLQFPKDVCLVLGNEAHGISPGLGKLISRRITIPSFGNAESLNVGMAAAIIIDNYRRSVSQPAP